MSTTTVKRAWPTTFKVCPGPWTTEYGIPASWGCEYKARLLARYKREVVAVQAALDSIVVGAAEGDAHEELSAYHRDSICVAVDTLLSWRGELLRRISLLDSQEVGVTLQEKHGLDGRIDS